MRLIGNEHVFRDDSLMINDIEEMNSNGQVPLFSTTFKKNLKKSKQTNQSLYIYG